MNLSFFFRLPSPAFHSIEEQFFAFQKHLPNEVKFFNIFSEYQSIGFINRLKIAFHARKNQSEINHITGDINFIAPFLKKQNTILTVHDIGSALNKKGLARFILKLFWFTIPFKSVKYITVISEFTKNEILKEFKVDENKIIVIPDCISDEFYYIPKDFNSEKPVILQIGTKINKNLHRLIGAISEINCKLLIIGKLNNSDFELLDKYKIDFENKYNLDFSQIIEEYKKSDIVSFVSTYEGFGVPILEAQAVGRPVLTSDLSPMKEVAGNGALLVNPFDISDIRQGIEKLISDKNLREKMSLSGIENAKKYSSKSIASEYYKLYKEISKK